MLVAVGPLAIFILSLINVKVKPVASILNEIRASLNDYPLADFKYDPYCTDQYYSSLYTFPGSGKGCSCVEVTNYYYDQDGQYEVNSGKCSSNQTKNGCTNLPGFEPKKSIKI